MKIIILLISFSAFGKNQALGRKYFQKAFGHLHKNASKESSSLTIIQCSHSVKLLSSKHKVLGWSYVEVGDDKGYVQDEFLGKNRPYCFQGRYPRFYSEMKLDITEMYYWGRLNDQYLEGRSRAK